ncbi:hypothetical protein [Pectobacterium polaris]|uniref:hypothetical protein n=1 Tax=Pectobacterium polaris TaxID=2042057 RepID=UPI001581BBFE|nr:hypothetical protein [Pectobacterium polaris]
MDIVLIQAFKFDGIYDAPQNYERDIYKDDYLNVKILGFAKYLEIYENKISGLNDAHRNLTNSKKKRIQSEIHDLEVMYHSKAFLYIDVAIPYDKLKHLTPEQLWDKPPHLELASNLFSAATSAITACRESIVSPSYEKISEDFYARENGMIIRDFSIYHIKQNDISMMHLDNREIDSAIKVFEHIYNKKEFKSITSLFSQSLIPTENARLFSFISAWRSLEVFIAKSQQDIKEISLGKLRNKSNDSPDYKLIKKILDVTDGKYHLLQRFYLLATYYNENNIEEDYNEFQYIQKVRNDYFHGTNIDQKDLPLERTQKLFRKYFIFKLRSELK